MHSNLHAQWHTTCTSLDTSSRTLFVREGGCLSTSRRTSSYVITSDCYWTSSYVITSDCYLNIVVSLDCYWTYLIIRICITVIPPSLPPPLLSPPPSPPSKQIHCPFQPKQSPSSNIEIIISGIYNIYIFEHSIQALSKQRLIGPAKY